MGFLPNNIQKLLSDVSRAALENGLKCYVGGETIKRHLKADYPISNIVDIILVGNIIIDNFYAAIRKNVVVEKELVNNPSEYTIVVFSTTIVRFKLFTDFDPQNPPISLARYAADSHFVEASLLSNKTDIDITQIKSRVPYNKWQSEDVLGFAIHKGQIPESIVDSKDLNQLRTVDLYTLKPSLEKPFQDWLIDILLTKFPGTALDFMIQTFTNAKPWLFDQLVNLMRNLDAPMGESASPEVIFSDKKLSLLNVYNEFFLFEQKTSENSEARKNRLLTGLKLLFDAAKLEIEKPYIDRVSVLISPATGTSTVELMGLTTYCPYPPCTCDPTECGNEGGQPCCCCHSVDIVSQIKARCHRKIVASCDRTGLKPGPNDEAFPEQCGRCFESCASILCDESGQCGPVNGYPAPDWHICSGKANELPPWWFISPPTPCQCDCALTDGNTCALWCATCDGPEAFCESTVEVNGYDCNYTVTMTPSANCCGTISYANASFVIDISGSMAAEIAAVSAGISSIVNQLSQSGTVPAFSLVTYRNVIFTHSWSQNGDPNGTLDWCNDGAKFANFIGSLTASGGGDEYQFAAILRSLNYVLPIAKRSVLLVVTDETDDGPETASEVIAAANVRNVTIFYIGPINGNEIIATQTGGQFWDLNTILAGGDDAWNAIFEEVGEFASSFPTSCDCLDERPIHLRKSPTEHPECACSGEPPVNLDCQEEKLRTNPDCFKFPIGIRSVGDDPGSNRCDEPMVVYACGSTITIVPDYYNEVCCSDLVLDNGVSLGCTCPTEPPPSCCGPHCVDICDGRGGAIQASVEQAQDDVWNRCIEERVSGSPSDPCLTMRGPNSSTYEACKTDIDAQTANWYWSCFWPTQKADWTCADAKCDYVDECIVAHPRLPLANPQCSNANVASGGECTSIQHPDVVVLNNGVGLVAYESFAAGGSSVIKLQQFKTSVRHKLLPNRKFNWGRLENPIRWETDTSTGLFIARLYSTDPIPATLIQGVAPGSINSEDTTTWKDVIAFRSGPLRGGCYPLADPAYGSDPNLGEFVRFYAPSIYSEPFPSNDDVYNIKWFIYDVNEPESYLIGDSDKSSQAWAYKQFLFNSRDEVDSILTGPRITTHIYNGNSVPVAYPRIATAENYSNSVENSHHVFLVYQALEDSKWNVYLRQIRLSEYSYKEQRENATLVAVDNLSNPPTQAIYRVVCRSDRCEALSETTYLLQRTVVFELNIPDGREILNGNFVGTNTYWENLCHGQPSSLFPRDKIFAQLVHSVLVDRCPDQFDIDEIFYDWDNGQEYLVSLSVSSGQSLYSSVQRIGDSAIPIGQFSEPLVVANVSITNSTVAATWYESKLSGSWKVISDESFDINQEIMGLDISEPICLTENERGHCSRPVVKVNYNNDVYVAYESTENDTTEIRILGTAEPVDILPTGKMGHRDLDDPLVYFLKRSDFTYENTVASSGVNQAVDMYIDLNDVIHLTWQSNRDRRWEIYYSNSLTDFYNKRITDAEGRSFHPRIAGNDDGNLFIVWHDNRFGNYEIMMAHHPGRRLIPLYQQDPYLASVDNFYDGWRHATDNFEFTMRNASDGSKCFTNVAVKFYSDRTLKNHAFTVNSTEYPFAFNIPGAQSDSLSSSFSSLTGWNLVTNFVYDGYGDIESKYYIATSPEIDTFLDGSSSSSITLPDLTSVGDLESISVRASNEANDANSSSQWSGEVSINGLDGQSLSLQTLGIDSFGVGRYKQFKIKFNIFATNDSSSIGSNADDAYLKNDNDWSNNATTVKFGWDATDMYDAYLRFPVNVPVDAEILQAILTVVPSSLAADSTTAYINLLDYDDASAFASTMLYSTQVPSSASDTYLINGADAGALDDPSVQMGAASDGTIYDSFLRFPVNLPKNAQISSANIGVISDNDHSDPNCAVEIKLLDEADVDEFTPANVTANVIVANSNDDMFISVERDLSGVEYLWTWFLDWNTLRVGHDQFTSYERLYDTYLRFDVSSIPDSAFVTQVVLTLTQKTVGVQSNVTIQRLSGTNVSAFTDPGNDTTPGPEVDSASIEGLITPEIGAITFDVTELYNDWLDDGGTEHFGLRLRIGSTRHLHQFDSFEVANPPILTIKYEVNVDVSSVAGISWTTSDPWLAGEEYQSPDIKTLVTSWLNKQSASYTSGNYMGLVMYGQSVPSANPRSFEGFDSDPHLHGGTAGASLYINYSISTLTKTGVKKMWQPSNWSVGVPVDVNISDIVQTYINRSGYAPGQHLGLSVDGDQSETGLKEFYSYDSGGNLPKLSLSYIPQFDWNFSTTSQTVSRVCLAPNESTTGSLDLMPLVRLDQTGNQLAQSPLPLDWVKNSAYFVGIFGLDENDTEFAFDNPKLSVSCADCYSQSSSWNYTSCAFHVTVPNSSTETRYYEIRVRFYADLEKRSPVAEFNTTNTEDLQCFTTSSNEPATNHWTDKGREVAAGHTLSASLWPQLSNTTGLVCGISYYVETSICSITIDEPKCALADFIQYGPVQKWICSCQSVRWDGRIEDSPVNLRELYRWKSSADGSSDTRITETKADNLNPVIRIRNSLNGVILYESNRTNTTTALSNPGDRDHRIYASVFSVIPSATMYASAVESINTTSDQVVHQSDIDICADEGCFRKTTSGWERTSKDPLKGTYAAFDLDQYDNIFAAIEKPYSWPSSDAGCTNLEANKQKYVVVHRCGANSEQLDFSATKQGSKEEEPCYAEKIIESVYSESDSVFASTVRMVRVNSKFVDYHAYRNNRPCPVVSVCSISFDVIGTNESVAIRIKESSQSKWSNWRSFDPTFGENTMELNHVLSPSSGIKTIEFQVATPAGLTGNMSLSIIADFKRIPFSVKFYRPAAATFPSPPELPSDNWETDTNIWDGFNLLAELNGTPVASIRPSTIDTETNSVTNLGSDYVYIEIIPDRNYVVALKQSSIGCITPTFDFIQQGGEDVFNLTTRHVVIEGEDRFRGYISISRENMGSFKDGLAYIIPHFRNDCSDPYTKGTSCDDSTTSWSRDSYNKIVQGVAKNLNTPDDVWSADRNEIGKILHPVTLRPTADDPYLIFGDPNYRFDNE